jgi:hypothetical protein
LRGKHLTNMRKHLKIHHKAYYDKLIEDKVKSKTKNEDNSKQLRLEDMHYAKKAYEDHHPKQKEFNRQLVILVGSRPLPNYMVSFEEYRFN